MRVFGLKLRYLRTSRDLSQTALAQYLSVQRAHINNLESGRRSPSIQLVCDAHDFFRVAVDYLLQDTIPADQPILLDDNAVLPCQGVVVYAQRLRALRLEHELSQVVLAQRLELRTQAHISLLEHGQKEPSIRLVIRTAEVFGVTTDSLLCAAKELSKNG